MAEISLFRKAVPAFGGGPEYILRAPALRRLRLFPESASLQEVWRADHASDFGKALELGLKEGVAEFVVANKAAMIYANYLEDDEARMLSRFQDIAACCEELQAAEPGNPHA